MRPESPRTIVRTGNQEAAMTARERPLCDCPEPCGCQVKRACLQKVMTLLAREFPGPLRAGGGLGAGGQ